MILPEQEAYDVGTLYISWDVSSVLLTSRHALSYLTVTGCRANCKAYFRHSFSAISQRSSPDTQAFIHENKVQLQASGCTCILCTNASLCRLQMQGGTLQSVIGSISIGTFGDALRLNSLSVSVLPSLAGSRILRFKPYRKLAQMLPTAAQIWLIAGDKIVVCRICRLLWRSQLT